MSSSLMSNKKSINEDTYGIQYEEEDEDDDDLDDDFDGLSEYDEEEILLSRNIRRCGDHSQTERSGRPRSISEGSLVYLEGGDDNRRDHHNQLERKRRASIKTSYNDLREVIPSLQGSKASRALILQRAVEYIKDLIDVNRSHSHCVQALKRQNEILDERVQMLQRMVHRIDGEESTSNAPTVSNSSTSNNTTLRLVTGTGTSSTLPLLRILPQDTSSSTMAPTQAVLARPSTNGMVHVVPAQRTIIQPSRARASPTLHLIGGPRSAFSSQSSSNGANDATHSSSSQRSSPGALSSSSSTTSSLFPQHKPRTRGFSETDSLIIDLPANVEDEEPLTSRTSLQSSTSISIRTSPAINSSSATASSLSTSDFSKRRRID